LGERVSSHFQNGKQFSSFSVMRFQETISKSLSSNLTKE